MDTQAKPFNGSMASSWHFVASMTAMSCSAHTRRVSAASRRPDTGSIATHPTHDFIHRAIWNGRWSQRTAHRPGLSRVYPWLPAQLLRTGTLLDQRGRKTRHHFAAQRHQNFLAGTHPPQHGKRMSLQLVGADLHGFIHLERRPHFASCTHKWDSMPWNGSGLRDKRIPENPAHPAAVRRLRALNHNALSRGRFTSHDLVAIGQSDRESHGFQ